MNKTLFKLTAMVLILGMAGIATAQNWNLSGNTLTGSERLGTNNAFDLKFYTDSSLRMNLKQNGRLGLNTSNPNAMFEIDYCLSPAPNNGGFMVTKTLCPSGFTFVPFDPNTEVEVIGFPFDGIVWVEDTSSQIHVPFSYHTGHTTNLTSPLMRNEGPLIWVRTKGDNGWLFGNPDNLDTKFIVMPDGSCGINIVQPRAALDVRGSQQYNHPAAIIGSLAMGSYSLDSVSGLPQYYTQQVQFVPILTVNGFNRISQANDQGMFFSDGKGSDGSNLNGSFILAPWAQEVDADTVGGMRMDRFGNTQFHGTLRATKLNVDAKWWSDFVFSDEYKMMSLTDLDSFINVNKHLPNVPSEDEVLENGIDVANMQAIQQQKIEELTLYIIGQQKLIEQMQAEIDKIKR